MTERRKLPKADLYVVITRKGRRVRAWGPYRRGTALRFRDAWREANGKHLEARVTRLEKLEQELEL